MSKSNAVFLALAAAAILAAVWYRQQVFEKPPAAPTSLHLAFVTGGAGPYWQTTVRGAESAAKELNIDLDVQIPTDDESIAQQMALLTKLKYAEFDGIAVSPLSAETQTQLINRIQQETNVVTFDADAPLSTRRVHVGTSNYGAGQLCARLVSEAIPGGGKIVVLVANLTKDNLIDRKSGFEEAIQRLASDAETHENLTASEGVEAPAVEFHVIDFLVDNGDNAACAESIRQVLADHPDLACLVGMNARHGPIIMTVLKELDQLGKVKVVAFDAEEATLKGVEEGHIFATIAQDPFKYGFEAVRMLHSLARDGGSEVPIVGGGTININAEALRQDDLPGFRERLQQRSALR